MFKVVIIDDDRFQRTIIKQTLQSIFPCDVKDFEYASDGLSVIDAFKPNLIISDICMPGMDGIEFVRSLAKTCCDIPLLLVSGVKEDILNSIQLMSKEYGIKAVSALTKPLSKEGIIGAMVGSIPELNIIQNKIPSSELSREYLLANLAQSRFVPYVQPQFATDGKTIVSAEVLVRWQHPRLGTLLPGQFLHAFEEQELMPDLTYSLMNSALQNLKRWQQRNPEFGISVNISPGELKDVKFTKQLLSLLDYYDINPETLTIEITETENYAQFAQSLDTINSLRIYGIKISMDDFGTGYANVQQFADSPVTEIKIDRRYTEKMLTNKRHYAVVEASLLLANRLEILSVAEGVNCPEVIAKLEQLGCHRLQGFSLAKPMPPEQFDMLDWSLA